MKKKVLLFLIVASFLFLPKVNALTCKYTSTTGYHVPNLNDWSGSLSSCSSNSGQCDHSCTESKKCSQISNTATASLSFTSDSNTSWTVKIDLSHSGTMKATQKNGELVENWSNPLTGFSTVGKDYITSEKCPSYLIVKSGVGYNAYVYPIIAASESEANNIINLIISGKASSLNLSGGSHYYYNQFIYIMKNTSSEQGNDDESSQYSSCLDFDESNCTSNNYYSCMWNEKYGASYCNYDDLVYVKCGDAWDIPNKLPAIISFFINFLKIATPIILVIVSLISLVKAVASSKEDEMKKAQNTLVKRIIAAVIVFFVIQITQFVMLKVADSGETGSLKSCFSCFLNNDCSKNMYYKTNVGGEYKCTYLSNTGSHEDCE